LAGMRRLALLAAAAVALAAAAGASGANRSVAPLPAARADFLQDAVAGVGAARRAWWNPRLGWYDDRLDNRWNRRMPLARLWSAFPLFEAVDALAIAHPTPANIAAVHRFAAGARRYFNPALRPVGGFAYYPGVKDPHQRAYFDDNGWWAIAFLDAYRATKDRSYLADARSALRFIEVSGWDSEFGGTWWDTSHHHKTSEPLAAAAYVNASLYRITRDPAYLRRADHDVTWADANWSNPDEGLVGRNDTDDTVMDYVTGMMIGAQLELCRAGRTSACTEVRQLGSRARAHWPGYLHWTPAADAIYLRFMLDLYRWDGDRRIYESVYRNAVRARERALAPGGLWLGRWDGGSDKNGLLMVHAATTSLFAWLAAAPAPPRL
jgi:hypothetical protein